MVLVILFCVNAEVSSTYLDVTSSFLFTAVYLYVALPLTTAIVSINTLF